MPGQLKTVSISAVPEMSAGSRPPSSVTTGRSALRRMCRWITLSSRSLLALEVRLIDSRDLGKRGIRAARCHARQHEGEGHQHPQQEHRLKKPPNEKLAH